MKKIKLSTLVLALSLSGTYTTFAATPVSTNSSTAIELPAPKILFKSIGLIMGEPNYTVNDAYQDLQHGMMTQPQRQGDIVFVPMEDIVEIGLSGDYQRNGNKVSIKVDNNQLDFVAGAKTAQVNGKTIKLDTPAYLDEHDNFFLPFNFVIQALGGEVRWEPKRPRIIGTVNVEKRQQTVGFTRGGDITLATIFKQPAEWYGSDQAKIVAETFLSYQNVDGGWPKLENVVDVNLLEPVYHKGISTIDNDATFTQVEFLSMVYQKIPDPRYRKAVTDALNYILSGQYDNGGWPQFFPDAHGYLRQIAINDNALANILAVLKQIAAKEGSYSFIDDDLAQKSQQAYDKGIQYILSAQIEQNGVKTAWAAQYDEKTLKPARARAYELPSIASDESVSIIRTLMEIDNPSPEVIDAIQSSIRWLDKVKVVNYKLKEIIDESLPAGRDRRLIPQEGNVIWARFYEIGSDRPLFSSRNGVAVYALEDIQWERRANYNWYVEKPKKLLAEDYPKWQARWAPNENVLKH